MSDLFANPDLLAAAFRDTLEQLEQLYRDAGSEYARLRPELARDSAQEFEERLVDLHKGLVLKIFLEMARADRRLSAEELRLAEELVDHVYGKRLQGDELKQALERILEEIPLRWDALLGPFERLSPLQAHAASLQSLALRLADLVAWADRQGGKDKQRQRLWIERELQRVLLRVPLASAPSDSPVRAASGIQQAYRQQQQSETLSPRAHPDGSPEQLDAILAELEDLIGLDNIKQEVRELVHFLQIQKEREKHGLPQTKITLHSVFSGNPGTGKTTVARLFGRILGALGILAKGHLIETDRSGLVAEFAGQTGPKTNKRVDEALDGVLFIDEAYSLVAETGDDPYGAEAVQALLKRMEDDRQRLVVILAGYPEEMQRLLETNPGLSSRFPRHFQFLDYTATELGRIFQAMCRENHYALPPRTRAKLLLGFQHLLDHRDEHFGNGRLARNVFELAIRRLASRIAKVTPLTKQLLITLEADDILMRGVPAEVWDELASDHLAFRVPCSSCRQPSRLPQDFLGQRVRCRRCEHEFTAEWGEVARDAAGRSCQPQTGCSQ